MSDIWNWLTSNWGVISEVLGALIGFASVVTALTSTPVDDKILDWVKKFLGYFSLLTHKDAPGTLSALGMAGDEPLMFSRTDRK